MNRSLRFHHAIVLSLAVAGAGCGSSDAGGPSKGGKGAPDAAPTAPALVLTDELAIDEIAVYQAVKTTLVTEGALRPLAKINAPVIANRPALVRAFVKANSHARPKVDGELRVQRRGKADVVLHDGGKLVLPDLDDSVLENTLNFAIDAEVMTADATFSLKISSPAAPDTLVFPADGGVAPFNARTASQALKVTFVPVSYEADAAAPPIVPDLADLDSLRDALYAMYPVARVEVTVRQPLRWQSTVQSDGPGWDALLGGIMQLRRVDAAPRDVYYVGVLTPKPTLDQFCDKGGCILGMAPQASERDVGMRAALVLGYKNRSAGGTLAQELAHAMGRMHAPCGNPGFIDGDFPYTNGGIGVMGYDIVQKALVDAGGRVRDYMSYCGPVWTSDYTFQGVYDRMEIVSTQQQAVDHGDTGTPSAPAPAARMASAMMPSFRIDADGSVHEGPDLEVIQDPSDVSGEHVEVSYESANGAALSTAKGRVRKVSGTGGRIVVAPQMPIGAARARLRGAGVAGITDLRSRAR